MFDKGIRLAAFYSAGCPELIEMGYDAAIESFVRGRNTAPSARQVRDILERLDPYVYYQLIAGAIGEEDNFSESVIRAHWLGTGVLKPVEAANVRQVFANSSLKECFDVHKLAALAMKLRGLIGFVPHHNFCVLQLFAALKKGGRIPERLIIDADRCLVKPGKVLSSTGSFLQVKALSLVSAGDGGLDLNIRAVNVGRELIADQAVLSGFVSIHLGRAREVLSEENSQRLADLTIQAVKFSNK